MDKDIIGSVWIDPKNGRRIRILKRKRGADNFQCVAITNGKDGKVLHHISKFTLEKWYVRLSE